MKHFRKRVNKITRERLAKAAAQKMYGNNEKRKRYVSCCSGGRGSACSS